MQPGAPGGDLGVCSGSIPTAPGKVTPVTMPSPARTVSRSVRMLRRLGMSELDALRTVVGVVDASLSINRARGTGDLDWLESIRELASARVRGMYQPAPPRQEGQHDRAGRPGRPRERGRGHQ